MAGSPLGQDVAYPKAYSPEVLAPIPRAENRQKLGIVDSPLPFMGRDVWNAFELSWLDNSGKPMVARARFLIPVDSPNLIESKSFKLYLNSLNMECFSDIDTLQRVLLRDISQAAGAPVDVLLQPFTGMQEILEAPEGNCLDKYSVSCSDYEVNPLLLHVKEHQGLAAEIVEEVLYTDLFRSLCPVTGQPDWATIVICYKGNAIAPTSLLSYLISFREHQDYHENCVEKIFLDIQRHCRPQELSVEANFLRRGGLDINPVRATHDSIHYANLPRYTRQ
jgi:7-cyano-7-deazaguanine reductase